jgi:antibiotic biosynthesis monooxygenase (ABM) superfamily enzyme
MNNKKLLMIFGVWLFVYPIVTILNYLLRTFGSSLPFPVQTLITTLILVPVMIGWVAPFVRRRVLGDGAQLPNT